MAPTIPPQRASRATRRRAALLSLATLATIAAPATARAQIVNVQPLVAGETSEGPTLALEGSTDWRSGNTDLLLLDGQILARYLHGDHLVFALARGEFGLKSKERFKNSDFEHLRYRLRVRDPLSVETFVQHGRDEFRRLALRALWGAGPRVEGTFGDLTLAAGTAYMLELERLQEGAFPDSGAEQVQHRLSIYTTLAVQVAERVKLGQTTYVQPRFDDPSDVRVLQETALAVSANDTLAVKISLTFAYDAAPPAGVMQVDGVRKVALQLNF